MGASSKGCWTVTEDGVVCNDHIGLCSSEGRDICVYLMRMDGVLRFSMYSFL